MVKYNERREKREEPSTPKGPNDGGWKWLWWRSEPESVEPTPKSDDDTANSTISAAAAISAPVSTTSDGSSKSCSSTKSSKNPHLKKSVKASKNGAIYANIRGLYPKSDKSKIPYLADLAKETNAPFICITESHLNPDILDAEVSIPGYNIFRSDRIGRSHGGVVIYVRKDLAVKSELKDSNSYCDSLALQIPQLNLVLVNIYRPPSCLEDMFTKSLEATTNFLNGLEESGKCVNTYLVVGDFNFPFLKFSDSEFSVNNLKKCNLCYDKSECVHTSSEKRQASKLLEFSEEFFLDQYIKKPTRKQNILDLCFTNDHLLIHSYQTIINSLLRDHYTICINLNYKYTNTPDPKKINHYKTSIPEYDLKAGDEEDWLRLNLLLNQVDWQNILENLSPEESVSKFLTLLEEKVSMIFQRTPAFQQKEEQLKNQPEGRFRSENRIPKKIRNLMRNKSKLSKAVLKTKSVVRCVKLTEKLEEIELLLKSSYENRRLEKENQAIKKIKMDPKVFSHMQNVFPMPGLV